MRYGIAILVVVGLWAQDVWPVSGMGETWGGGAMVGVAKGAVLYVDNGNTKAGDGNDGTMDRPMRTIGGAMKKVKAGDKVVVRAGVYREVVELTVSGEKDRPVVLESEEEGKVVISGATQLDHWVEVGGGVWGHRFEAMQEGWERHALLSTWLYVDGVPMERGDVSPPDESGKREDMKIYARLPLKVEKPGDLPAGYFMTDFGKKMIYMKLPGDKKMGQVKMEYAHREGLIHSTKPVDYVVIRGLTLVHNGGWWRGKAAIDGVGSHWVIEENHILWSSSCGIKVQQSNGTVIRKNRVEWCGQMSMGASECVNLTVEDNELLYGNWRGYNASWEAGLSKFSMVIDGVFRRNHAGFGFGAGLWLDGFNVGNLMEDNYCHDLRGGGEMSEISWDTIHRGCLSLHNLHGINIGEASEIVVEKCVLMNNDVGVEMQCDMTRKNMHGEEKTKLEERMNMLNAIPGITQAQLKRYREGIEKYNVSPPKWPLRDCRIVDNIFIGNNAGLNEFREYGKQTELSQWIDNWSDQNIYWAADESALFTYNRRNGRYGGLKQWQEASGRDKESRIFDPRKEGAEVPAWAQKGKELWAKPYLVNKQVKAMGLVTPRNLFDLIMWERVRSDLKATAVKLKMEGVVGLMIEHEGDRVLVICPMKVDRPVVMKLKVGAEKVVVENAYLMKQETQLKDGVVELQVHQLPWYIRGVGQEIEELVEAKQ